MGGRDIGEEDIPIYQPESNVDSEISSLGLWNCQLKWKFD